jgi:hypothetical protein
MRTDREDRIDRRELRGGRLAEMIAERQFDLT